ncbi:MAG TPA: methylenetetrahydrofolate--tRNA-(uracil(54)-C(5))-methyltransferase (FADH(2)-oxidizing) TrmFO [Candidatus Wallbacteria bacterium]|nr:methylenetetrahydrofolate--tRNA-(uracil(54)-C(5))-methyltransferase (FADH(2)-oxidizing) TrmFO [Candidatus Wallbacteria bacterium]
MKPVNIIGGGLSGVEAALTLGGKGIKVNLFEARPEKMPEVFKTAGLCELVCSNSLGSLKAESAPGILKSELAALGSYVIEAAREASVPGGQALCVDRARFSALIEDKVRAEQNITLLRREVKSLDEFEAGDKVIIASGPLTTDALFSSLSDKFTDNLYFYDAVSPVIEADSVDMARAFWKNRYSRGADDYLNIALNKDEYFAFYRELIAAKTVPPRDNEKEIFFESCMPIEELARRGEHTLRFGPMKPKGFEDPRTGKMPYAVIQLRRENNLNSAFNIVGFQTKMTFGEQTRVLSVIPGLEKVKILRYGVIHKNYYMYSPGLVNFNLSLKSNPDIFVAGQLLGSEGYSEAVAGRKLAALNIIDSVKTGRSRSVLEYIDYERTMIGSLIKYLTLSAVARKKFVPMNSNFGLVDTKSYPKDTFHQLSNEQISLLTDMLKKY